MEEESERWNGRAEDLRQQNEEKEGEVWKRSVKHGRVG